MKTCLIKQPAGIGDILFCQGIAKHYLDLGYRVIYPLRDNLLYLKNYIINNNIVFCSVNDDFNYKEYYISHNNNIFTNEFIFINLDTSHNQINNHDGIMPSKYQSLGLNYNIWINSLHIHRNLERENWLFYEYLKLKDGEDYILLNTKFGTPPDYKEFPFPNIDTDSRLIDMAFIENTTIMDWLTVLEKARGIVTVDTCVQYLMEKLSINYDFYYCYTRDGTKNHITKFGIDKIFTIPWTYLTSYK